MQGILSTILVRECVGVITIAQTGTPAVCAGKTVRDTGCSWSTCWIWFTVIETIPVLVEVSLIDEAGHCFFEIGENAFGCKGDWCCSGTVFVGKVGSVREFCELVVVIGIPYARHGVRVDA